MAIGTVERFRESLDGHDVKDNPKKKKKENEWKSPLFKFSNWTLMDFLERICQLMLRSAVC